MQALILSLSLFATAQAPLEVGVASVDITPPRGYRMAGYFNERLNTGTKDPLWAKAMVFRQGDTQAALVFCDLVEITRDVAHRARRRAEETTGIPAKNVGIAATHSHTGPLYEGTLRDHFHAKAEAEHGRDPREEVDYPSVLADKVVEAIALAQKAARPARLRHGVGKCDDLSFNRRFHMKDGTVRFNPGQQNPDIVRVAGPIDPDVGVVIVADEKDKPVAGLTVFAMHLDTVGGTEYSADYPFFLEAALRKELGDMFTSLFGAGTCGDINHIDVKIKGRRPTNEIGGGLANAVIAALPKLKPIERPSLAVATEPLTLPVRRPEASEVAEAREKIDLVGKRKMPFLEEVRVCTTLDLAKNYPDGTVTLDVQAFRLGPELAVVTLPGEVFVEHGLAIKAASPFETTLVVELANADPAYVPTRKAFAEGSYETVNSRIAPGGGEKLVETAVKLLRSLE